MKIQKIHILLATVILLSLTPFLWLFTQSQLFGGPWEAFTNISGFIGGTLLFWQIIIGNRGIFKKITSNFPPMLKFHMQLGIYGTLFVLIHPILITLSYGKDFFFLITPDFTTEFAKNVSFGKMALVLFIIVWLTSALIKKKLPYKTWLYIHYLSYLIVFFVFIHPLEIGTFMNQFPLLKGYWLTMFAIFGLIVIRRVYMFIKKPQL